MHTRATSLRSNFANSSMRIRNNLYAAATAGQNRSDIYYTCHYANMRSGRNGKNVATYNIIALPRKTMQTNECSKTNTELHNAVIAAGNGQSVPQWRRNNFKPLYPDVMECEDDLDTLMHSTPTSEEPNSSSAGSNKVNVSAGPGFIFKTTGKSKCRSERMKINIS